MGMNVWNNYGWYTTEDVSVSGWRAQARYVTEGSSNHQMSPIVWSCDTAATPLHAAVDAVATEVDGLHRNRIEVRNYLLWLYIVV